MLTQAVDRHDHSKVREGWNLHLWEDTTTAARVEFWIGTPGQPETRRMWAEWCPGDPVDFRPPDDFAGQPALWFRAKTEPANAAAYMCLRHDGHVVKHMEFSGEEETERNQGDRDSCAC